MQQLAELSPRLVSSLAASIASSAPSSNCRFSLASCAIIGVEGIGESVARNFRDKARMKDVLRDAGVPCARHKRLNSAAEAGRSPATLASR